MSQTDCQDEPTTSASMLARAKDGDAESWKQLAQIYGPIVYRWARRCGCQAADAADVMQDTFVAVSRALSRFDNQRDGATFRGWLWTISRNKIRDLARPAVGETGVGGTDANVRLEQITDASVIDSLEPPTNSQTDFIDAKRRMVELLRQGYDERSWRMFWETTVIGRQPVDVADEMGVSKWAVYKARARVLQRLQQEMKGLE